MKVKCITANHEVRTEKGWKKCISLKKGDKIIGIKGEVLALTSIISLGSGNYSLDTEKLKKLLEKKDD